MLRVELDNLDAEQGAIDARRAAIKLLINDDGDETPAATFTAADAERHVERKGGSKNRADITDAQLRDIRDRAKTTSHAKLSQEYNVSRATIGNIVRRAGCYA